MLDLRVLNNVKKFVHVRLIIENIISNEQKKLPQDATRCEIIWDTLMVLDEHQYVSNIIFFD